jgi:GTP-binding protein
MITIKSSDFVTSAVKPTQYPPDTLPEIAFAGRSNVGKSSLINTLINRRRLVRTSSTPGRTQLINFFAINASFFFVDLPGFGYAKVPAAIQKQWKPMVETYLAGRRSLNGVVLLFDIRRSPRQEEFDLIQWLQLYGLPMLPVLTKADKLSKNKQSGQQRAVAQALGRATEDIILFSAKTRQGRDRLWNDIEKLMPSSPGERFEDHSEGPAAV